MYMDQSWNQGNFADEKFCMSSHAPGAIIYVLTNLMPKFMKSLT
jgi:hypothetical protein